MAYDRTNTGALWIQEEKKSEKAPDVKGIINIDGVDHAFVGWKKHTVKGPMYSLVKDKPREAKPTEDKPRPSPTEKASVFDDQVPF